MEKSIRCPIHDAELKYYCGNLECKTFICKECLKHFHQNHFTIHIEDYLPDKMQDMKLEMDELDTFLKHDEVAIQKVKDEYLDFMKLVESKKSEVGEAIREEAERRLARWEEYCTNHLGDVGKQFHDFMAAHVERKQKVFKELALLKSAHELMKQCEDKKMPHSKFIEFYKLMGLENTEGLVSFANEEYYSAIKSEIKAEAALHVEMQRKIVKSMETQGLFSPDAEYSKGKTEDKLRVLKKAFNAQFTDALRIYEEAKRRYSQLVETNNVYVQNIERMTKVIKEYEIENTKLANKLKIMEQENKMLKATKKEKEYLKRENTVTNLLNKQGKQVVVMTSHLKEISEKLKKMQDDIETTSIKISSPIEAQTELIQKLCETTDKTYEACMQANEILHNNTEKFTTLQKLLLETHDIAANLLMVGGSVSILYKFTSKDQIYGTADCINKEEFINANIGYTGTQFHFDSKESNKYIAFDMSKSPEKICKMRMWSSGISNNVFSINYSKDGFTWTKYSTFQQSSGWSAHTINVMETYPYWGVIVITHGGRKPWYCIEWYKPIAQLRSSASISNGKYQEQSI
eukprot:TRINITY_DN64772_c0_g1_i1.p1 TRINITY_DN64772_c0_g1~~TRINITY_DN64772_c0_g1_i1.p1  ORF type:complete len:575 (-),score=66.30 TRINITY_DN64772_c0_g1_i1:252-1976(-)